MTNQKNKTEFSDNNLQDSPADRDIWDRLLDSDESNIEIQNMISKAEKEAEDGNLSPMDE